jgi:peptidoglycan/LPS O-acetylase OafA/YrhL
MKANDQIEKEQIQWLAILRGWAVLLVIILHGIVGIPKTRLQRLFLRFIINCLVSACLYFFSYQVSYFFIPK